MNSDLIRERLNRNTKPFALRLSDGSRVAVPHPDFVAMAPPGIGLVIVWDRKGRELRIDPLHIVAIEETAAHKSTNGRRSP
jgi:hypothetical protein